MSGLRVQDFANNHRSRDIDFCTAHIWVRLRIGLGSG